MKIAAYRLNEEGLTLSKSKLQDALITALAQHSKFNIFLFNKCVLDSPSFVDWIAIKRFLTEEYPDVYSKFKNALDGTIEFTSHRMHYILGGDSSDKILYAIQQLLNLEEHINSLNSIYDGVKFKKTLDTAIYKPSIIVTSKVVNRNKVSAHRKDIFDCIEGENNLLVCDGYKIVCKYLCERYGVEYKAGCSIFMQDKDEILDLVYLNDFITGKIKGDTLLADKLFKDITEYYYEYSLDYATENSGCMRFEEHIFNACLDDLIIAQKEFREKNPDCYPFAVESFAVFYYKKRDALPFKLPYNLFGLDCIDYYSGNTLHIKNSLCGICGEFIAESDIVKNNLTSRGMPLELYVTETKRAKYYPLINVRDCNNNFLEPKLNNDLYYVPEEYIQIDEDDEYDEILNKFLSYKHNFGDIDTFVSTRLKFSDTKILDTCVGRLKNLGVL